MSNPEERMQQAAMELGHEIEQVVSSFGAAFMLLIYDEGEDGWTTYLTNAYQEDLMEVLKDLIERMKEDRSQKVHEA